MEDRYTGYLWREHPSGASPETKAQRIRNSLDNELSFWPDERAVLDALKDVGFGYVSKIMVNASESLRDASRRVCPNTMEDASLCAMGGMTPYPVRSVLKYFAEDFAPDARQDES